MLKIGCHVSAAGGVWNAPKNAADLNCETFQIFTRPPQGGKGAEIDDKTSARFKAEMENYRFKEFVVHTPYYINFGSIEPRIYHGSISVVRQELERSDKLGALYVMTHLGSFKDLGEKDAFKQTKDGLKKVLEDYEGETKLLLEIAAGGGNIIGDTFEELAEIMEPLVKFKGFGGVCFDTQHAFASGYDLRMAHPPTGGAVEVFSEFDKVIGLKHLKMSHINDSKTPLGSRKDRHQHIGDGEIGVEGFKSILEFFSQMSKVKGKMSPFPLILETEHDKVEADIKLLKSLRDNLKK